ncbi:MAG TPA: hypothetical protein VK212_03395, partial [Lentimicrobium sp.]|nr:hypothetical protein [Lentimicrobium sp.]
MLKREIEEATQKLQETKIARSLLKITNNWDPANASSLNGSGEVVRLFFYDYIFRNDLIIYSHLVKVNENYRKINCLSAMALVEDDLMAGDEASDNILRYLDCPDTFYELEKEYIKSNLIRNDRHYRRNLYRKNKQILYGAILLMYHHKIFRPNYELENGNWKRLTE